MIYKIALRGKNVNAKCGKIFISAFLKTVNAEKRNSLLNATIIIFLNINKIVKVYSGHTLIEGVRDCHHHCPDYTN